METKEWTSQFSSLEPGKEDKEAVFISSPSIATKNAGENSKWKWGALLSQKGTLPLFMSFLKLLTSTLLSPSSQGK